MSQFFLQEGDNQSIALTSTSANHVANMAKEYLQTLKKEMNDISLVATTVELIGSGNPTILNKGKNKEFLDSISIKLHTIVQAQSLIAWLREAIKEKDKMLREISATSVKEWCNKNDKNYPEAPIKESFLTEEEFYNSLSVKTKNNYYQLETLCAVIGKYIHPDGSLSEAREKLKEKINNPNDLKGSGRDALVYTYTPTVSIEEIDNLFFTLQDQHRSAQAELNAMKHKCEVAISQSIIECENKYTKEMQEYNATMSEIISSYNLWKEEEARKVSKLKIIIPNDLIGIYNTIKQLGK
jgi:hypothetical protein